MPRHAPGNRHINRPVSPHIPPVRAVICFQRDDGGHLHAADASGAAPLALRRRLALRLPEQLLHVGEPGAGGGGGEERKRRGFNSGNLCFPNQLL